MSKHIRIVLSIVLIAVALTSSCQTSSPPTSTDQSANATEGVNIGNLAPDFQLQTLDGKTVKLSNYRGKPVLLNFWATWCPPCRFEMPFLQQVNDAYASKGLVLLAVDLTHSTPTETPEAVRAFMASLNLSMTVPMDTDKKMGKLYSLTGIPTTFLLDKGGVIRWKIVGAFPNKTAIEEALKTIMP